MAIFNFPMHKQETEYPDSGFRVTLGNSYQFAAPPSAPDQRKFTLKFALMKWFLNTENLLDRTQHPEFNLAVLDDFYNRHKTWAVFIYPHPVYGNLPCRFNKPLKIPTGIEGGNGAVVAFEIELLEQPGMVPSFGV